MKSVLRAFATLFEGFSNVDWGYRVTVVNNEMYVDLARLFHDTYERLAPQFGYETRKETREFDPKSANGRLMVAVMREIFPPR